MKGTLRHFATCLFTGMLVLFVAGCDNPSDQRTVSRPTEVVQAQLPVGGPTTPTAPGNRNDNSPDHSGRQPYPDTRIFIVDALTGSFVSISPQTGEETSKGQVDPRCGVAPIPRATSVVCQGDGRLFLVDILDGKSRDLGIGTHDYYEWDPTGSYLMYLSEVNGTTLVHSLGLTSSITATFPEGAVGAPDRWLDPPKLDPSGKKLLIALTSEAAPNNARVYVGDSATATPIPLTPAGQMVTWDLEWSPQGDSFVYGVTDVIQEIGPRPNMIYRYDFSRNLSHLLVRAPDGDSFVSWSLEYSPSGDRIFVALASGAVCVVDLNAPRLDCMHAQRDDRGRYAAWSPDGTDYALVDAQRRLVVIDSQNRVKTIVRSEVPDRFTLFWR